MYRLMFNLRQENAIFLWFIIVETLFNQTDFSGDDAVSVIEHDYVNPATTVV